MTVLEEAGELIQGSRNKSYGKALTDFTATGKMFSAILSRWLHSEGILKPDEWLPDLPPDIFPMLVITIKLSRQAHFRKRDNSVDICGYAALMQEILDETHDNQELN